MSDEIVVGVDASEAGRSAVRWAADAAASRQAPLRLVTVLPRWAVEMPDKGRYAEVGRWAREDAANVVEGARAAAAEGHPGLEVTTEVLPGDVKPALVERVATASLAVVGTRGSGGFLDLVVGSVALTVAARAACPTVVVRDCDAAARRKGRVLVGLDLTEPTPEVLDVAAEEALRRGAGLHLAGAISRVDEFVDGTAERLSDEDFWYLEHDQGAVHQALSAIVEDLESRHQGLEISTELQTGHPVDLLSRTSAEADLLVLGRRQLRRQTPLGLGSTTRGALADSRCPVMVVPVQGGAQE